MTVALPPLPPRIARLPKDERGYPVPKFVEWFKDGRPAVDRTSPGVEPDFRYADGAFRLRAFQRGLCWICGERTGVHRVFAIGPMCVINRTTSEPASHRECAEFAARACPFLIRPRQKRNEKGLGEETQNPGGTMIKRNPGCVALYETREAKAFNAGDGWLIRLGEPDRVDWWAEGRQATRAEIQASIDSGFPLLFQEAAKDGLDGIDELARLRIAALKLLPAA